MRWLDSYTVYNRVTGEIVAQGTFTDIEEYTDIEENYAVVWDYTGDEVVSNR